MRKILPSIMLAAAGVAIGSAGYLEAAPGPVAVAPKARYAMDVGTTTGLAAMGSGMGAAMGMMFGGGNRQGRELHLRLGSSLAADGGGPRADHFFLPSVKLGKSVPLLSPENVASTEQEARDKVPQQFQRPKGRLLLFWGCGEHAPKGQPVVIDFAKIAQGQFPPNLFSARVPVDRGPTASNSRTYGEWPNAKSPKMPGSGSSLLGAHRIAATYAPEINFTLAQDYLPALFIKNTPLPSGAIGLSWNDVAGATGFYGWTFGGTMNGDGMGDMVWWSSSATREFGGGLWDWLPPETARRLVNERVVMPPTQTQCAIPAEVKAAAPSFMLGNMVAYGPQADFTYPPRPSGPVAGWRPDWTARVRFRSSSTFLIGGPGMPGVPTDDQSGASPPPKRCKGGLLGAALGVC